MINTFGVNINQAVTGQPLADPRLLAEESARIMQMLTGGGNLSLTVPYSTVMPIITQPPQYEQIPHMQIVPLVTITAEQIASQNAAIAEAERRKILASLTGPSVNLISPPAAGTLPSTITTLVPPPVLVYPINVNTSAQPVNFLPTGTPTVIQDAFNAGLTYVQDSENWMKLGIGAAIVVGWVMFSGGNKNRGRIY